MYKGLNDFINILEKENELLRIKELVNPNLEITEITDRISKLPYGGKAILFENTGTDFPILINAFGSKKRIALALGKNNLEEIDFEINALIKELTSPKAKFFEKISAFGTLKQISNFFPKTITKGQCQEVIYKEPNLDIFPILKCWPFDGGKFITLPIVHTNDLQTNIRNVGMYRLQVFEKNLTGMHWHKHKVGARHYQQYKENNTKIPVAVALGGDPVYTYVATAPLPDNIDEYLLAGFLRKKSVKLVKCLTQNIEVPADADIILEGYIDPQEELILEGPFGDHTGFYSEADYYPKFHITCITHKKNAIYPTTIVGIPPQEDAYLALATEKIFLPLIQKSIAPEIIDMHLPEAGVAHNFSIIKIKKQYDGHAQKIMNSLWGTGQMSLNKCLFVTDKNIDIKDYKLLISESLISFNPENDIFYSKGPIDVLDHASESFTYGSKIGFDFTNEKTKEFNESNYNYLSFENFSIFPFIKKTNSLHTLKIPIIILSINKNENILSVSNNLLNIIDFSYYKIIIFIDNDFDIFNLYTVAWLLGNNIAPLRDTFVINKILIVDATTKTETLDKYNRNWPKTIVMDKETIKEVDEKWKNYNIGSLIESPSQKFIDLF